MGQNIYIDRFYSASGADRGAGQSSKPKQTMIKGRVDKIESHTPSQFILSVTTSEGEKRLKIGTTNFLSVEKNQVYLFSCRPNTGVNDGADAKWTVTKKPERAVSHKLSANVTP